MRRPSLSFAVACVISAASPVHADTVHDVLDLARRAAHGWADSQESRTATRVLAVLDRAEDAIEFATAVLEGNPIRGAGFEAAVTTGGGIDIDRGGAEVAAVVSAHLDGDQCHIAEVNAVGRWRTGTNVDERARASAEGSVGACLPEGIIMPALDGAIAGFPIRGTVFAALNKTPALTAARSLVPEAYSETGWSVWMEGIRYRRDHGRRYYAGLVLALDQRHQWLGYPSGPSARQEWFGDAAFARFARRRPPDALANRAIDLFGVGWHAVFDGDDSVGILQVWPLRISGLGLADKVLVDALVGASVVGPIGDANTGMMTTNEHVPERSIALVHAAISVGDRALAAGASYDRGLDTNLRLELVQEDRGTLWIHQERGAVRYRAAALVTRAQHFADTTHGREWLVGASFEGTYSVGHGVAVGLSLEVTHALVHDAVLDGRVPDDGLRAFANVSYTYGLAER